MQVQETNALAGQLPIYAVPAVSVNTQYDVQGCTVFKPKADFNFNAGDFLTREETKLDLNVHKVIIIPVNTNGNHWIIAFVSMDTKLLLIYNSQHSKSINCIGYEKKTEAAIMHLLKERCAADKVQFNYKEWRTALVTTPEQGDGASCGICGFTFAYFLFYEQVDADKMGKYFSRNQIADFRKRLQYSVMLGSLVPLPSANLLEPEVDLDWRPSLKPQPFSDTSDRSFAGRSVCGINRIYKSVDILQLMSKTAPGLQLRSHQSPRYQPRTSHSNR